MKKILVTVVLPIYNVEPYLDRSIQSIVNQTYQNLEILLIDDSSSDNCPQKCDEWAKMDPRIRVIHKQNQGLGMARNTGIENANGEYIFFIDSDDWVEPNLIKSCIEASVNTGADTVIYGNDLLNEKGSRLSVSVPNMPKKTFTANEIKDFIIPCLAGPIKTGKEVYHMSASAWSLMYSMNIIRKNHFRFVSEREIISEDIYSNLIYYQFVESLAVISEALYHYCLNNDQSLTRIYDPQRFTKNKLFYIKSLELCSNLGYTEQTKKNLSSPLMGNIIANIKQIIELNLPFKKRKEFVLDILNDEITEKIVSDYDTALDGKSFRRILIYCIKHKCINTLFILILLKKYCK